MYQLKAKVNFYDKEHPGVLLHTGELLSTKSEARAKDLVERGFAEIVSVPEAPKQKEEAPVVSSEAEAPVKEVEAEPEAETEAPEQKEEAVEVTDNNLADVRQALNAIGVKTAQNAGLNKVADKVAELSEAQMAELKLKLKK